MGIKREDLTESMRRCLDPQVRKELDIKAGLPNAGLTSQEARAKGLGKLEREEQRILARWLAIQEEKGVLVFDWSATHRKATRREGMPDFSIWKGGRALLGEMKAESGKLSEEQRIIIEAFARSGTEVQIWLSADIAVRRVRAWLWEHWRLWDQEEER
jgi:hypothetical protein